MPQHFNAELELEAVKNQRTIMRSQSYRKSRLLKFQAEIIALRKAGASLNDIALWLRQKKRLKVSHTTVMRFLAKLSEQEKKSHAQL